jgi:nucleosome binding factor SPN SPT16 subunit
MPGCGFPGLEGRTHVSIFPFHDCLVALVMKPYGVLTIIPELDG